MTEDRMTPEARLRRGIVRLSILLTPLAGLQMFVACLLFPPGLAAGGALAPIFLGTGTMLLVYGMIYAFGWAVAGFLPSARISNRLGL